MQVLWLTRQFPYPPYRGDLLYTRGLINALAATGARVTVLCYGAEAGAPASIPSGGEVEWLRVPLPKKSRGLSLFFPLPSDAYRLRSAAYAAQLRKLVDRSHYDAVCIDYFAMGWTSPLLNAHRHRLGRDIPIVYISHNYESAVRRNVASGLTGNPLYAAVLRIDGLKAARLEAQLINEASLVTAITIEDSRQFLKWGRPVVCLPPGYDGERSLGADVGRDTPRRAIIVGSFDWIAKQHSLASFVERAEPMFSEAGIELCVVGRVPAKLVAKIQSFARSCVFLGPLPEIAPELAKARIGVMPDELGGGFKLKVLDYVFRGLPFAAIGRQVAGLPLAPGKDFIAADDAEALARSIVAAIDDTERLNAMRRRSFEKCVTHFDWQESGARLCAALARVAAEDSKGGAGESAEAVATTQNRSRMFFGRT